MDAEQLYDAAMKLPYDQRFLLTEQLSDSLHPPGENLSPDQWWSAWKPEIQRRLAELQAGTAGIPAEQVFAELKARRD